MSPEEIAFYVQIGALIIAIPIVITFLLAVKKYFTHRGREDKLKPIANKFGFTFEKKPGNDFFRKMIRFGLLKSAIKKKAYNVMSGEIKGRQIKIFDMVYSVKTGIDPTNYDKQISPPQNRTVLLIELKDTGIDNCSILKEHGVWCKDEKIKNTVENSELIDQLNQTSFDIRIDIHENHLLLTTGPEFVPLDKMNEFIDDCMTITSTVENKLEI